MEPLQPLPAARCPLHTQSRVPGSRSQSSAARRPDGSVGCGGAQESGGRATQHPGPSSPNPADPAAALGVATPGSRHCREPPFPGPATAGSCHSREPPPPEASISWEPPPPEAATAAGSHHRREPPSPGATTAGSCHLRSSGSTGTRRAPSYPAAAAPRVP
ncbi:basic proline-rich protein-like [Papio anubis]|uniref:basic proline-rich protein-like n=1 Tax=Papio anubis TaxID=9555 RepID=UPI0004F20403|nr:basic proline-rich protein-like [Papio anubis]